MKKIAVVSIVIIFLLVTVFACSSTSNICPAYSNNDTEQTNDQNG
jgi:hypothetical protein